MMLLKAVSSREEGSDRTMDSKTKYGQAIEVPGVPGAQRNRLRRCGRSGQSTIRDLRLKVSKMQDLPLEVRDLRALVMF